MVDRLLCFIFLCLASLAACKDEGRSCTGSDCVLDDAEGLHMLQLKGSKQTSKRQCPFPVMPSYQLYGKGCPDPGEVHDGHTCFNGNTAYNTLKEAWEACGQMPECNSIMEHNDHKYYLRRDSDPDLPGNQGDYLLRYQCTQDQELQEKERLRQEAEDRKVEAIRQQKEDQVHQVEMREMKVSDDEHAMFQEKFVSQAWANYMEEGGMKDLQGHPNEHYPEDVQKDITRDFSELFSHFANLDCGYDDNDTSCEMDNQAFINDKMRNATDVAPDDVWSFCGRICEEAGTNCSGFTYKQGSRTCYFRKNTRCGISKEWGTSCFTKKIARHAADLADERATVLRETEVHHSLMFEVNENHDCGYSPTSKTCGMDNMAVINNGARDVPLVSAEEVFSICGLICQEAGDKCGGFTYKAENSTCYFRKNATCGIYEQDGTTCYTKRDPTKPLLEKKKVRAHNITKDAAATAELKEAEPAPVAEPAPEAAVPGSVPVAPAMAAAVYDDSAAPPAEALPAAPAEPVPAAPAEPAPAEPAAPVLHGP